MSNPIYLITLIALLAIGATVLWEHAAHIACFALIAGIGLDCLAVASQGIEVGATLFVNDMACLTLLFAGLVVLLREGRLPDSASWPVLALFVLLIINLARGTNDFGLRPAGNGARDLAYMLLPCLAWILLRPAVRINHERLAAWLVVIGSALTVIAVCRWMGLLPWILDPWDFRELRRPLTGEDAMLVGQGFLAIVFLQFVQGVTVTRACASFVLGAATLLLQHRSVWVSIGVGLLWLAFGFLRTAAKRWLQVAFVAFIGLIATLMALSLTGAGDRVISLLQTNIQEARQRDSTWNWRRKGFSEAVDRTLGSDLTEILIGPPSGRDLSLTASFASIHIHSRYVSTFAYYGVLGIASLLLWLRSVSAAVACQAKCRHGDPARTRMNGTFLQGLLLSQLVYFVPYSGGIAQGSLTALIWLTAIGAQKTRHPSQSRLPTRISVSELMKPTSRETGARPLAHFTPLLRRLAWGAWVTAVSAGHVLPYGLKRLTHSAGSLHHALHFLAFVGIAAGLSSPARPLLRRIAVAGCVVGLGALLELLQHRFYGDAYEWIDLCDDACGALLGSFAVSALAGISNIRARLVGVRSRSRNWRIYAGSVCDDEQGVR